MPTIHASQTNYALSITDGANWTLTEKGQKVLWSVDGILSDCGHEDTDATVTVASDEILAYATCFSGEQAEKDLEAFGREVAAQGW